jgi:SWI/SNF-related matrix-associated actin-dependent regulator 1 of chromatin subfamily A
MFPNKYPGTCTRCGGYVRDNAGMAAKERGRWVVYCAVDAPPRPAPPRPAPPRPAPEGVTLFPHQEHGIAFLARERAGRGAILADDMGLGKTAQALLALPPNVRGVVVCPAVAKNVWVREAARFAPQLQVTVLSGRGSFRWPEADEIVVTNFEILPSTEKGSDGFPRLDPELEQTMPPDLFLIVDEAHKVKNWSSKRTQSMRAISHAARKHPQGAGVVWLLTGTPLTNDPSETYSLLVAAGLQFETFGGKKDAAMGLAGGWPGRYGGWEFRGAIKPEFAERLKRVMLRRRKDEVLNLPPKRYESLAVNVGRVKEADLVLDALKGKGINLTKADIGVLSGGISFETMSRAREALSRAKAQMAMELAKSIVEDGEQVIVFSAHLAPVEACGTLEGFAVITGDTPNDERSRIEAAFQAGRIKGVAATIKAAGVALTLTAASRVIFVDQAWTPADNEQAEDRAYRIGQNKSVLITTLVADHELDERIATLLAEKRRLIRGTIEAARATKGEARAVPAPVVAEAVIAAPVVKPAPAPVIEDDFADLPF